MATNKELRLEQAQESLAMAQKMIARYQGGEAPPPLPCRVFKMLLRRLRRQLHSLTNSLACCSPTSKHSLGKEAMKKIREWEAMANRKRAMRSGSRWSKVRAKRALRSGLLASEAWAHFKQVVRAHRNPNPLLQGDRKEISEWLSQAVAGRIGKDRNGYDMGCSLS